MLSRLRKEDVKEFIFAGNSLFTLQSGKTGNYLTYKIKKCKNNDNLFFVYNLRSNNNDDDNSYQYIGCYYNDTDYFHTNKTYKDTLRCDWPQSLRIIRYLFDVIDNVPDNLIVLHHGRCAKCGRLLTTPESIERGLGPECYKRSKENE